MVASFFAFPANAQAPFTAAIPGENYVYAWNEIPSYEAPTWTFCSCVQYAKAVLGRGNESWGNAGAIAPTTDTPYPGAVVITTEGGGHVAVVTEVFVDKITIKEANYIPCAESERTLPLDNPAIRGYM